MQVPFIDLKAQLPLIREGIENRFAAIIDNTAFISGRNVTEFEERFARMHESSYAVALGSGTAANHLAALCCGIGPGDEVIVPVNTFIATAEGISHTGATPVFVDVDEKTYNMNPRLIEDAITSNTKAINPVHLYGQSADMNAIDSIASKHGLSILEDAAQAHIASYKNKKVGNLGIATAWSFYPGKNLGTWGEGGAITTNDETIYAAAKKYRDHGSEKKYYHDLIGYNYRMSEFQAAVLNVKLEFIEQWTEQRRNNASLYNSLLKDVSEVITPYESNDCYHVFHLYVIRVPRREELQAFLKERGIASGIHYPFPLHLTGAYEHLGYTKGDFPIAEKIAGEIVSLPMYPEMSKDQVEAVCRAIHDFF
jgi:dTDP-4-amino-4,6-dideoxygalactose transaminase